MKEVGQSLLVIKNEPRITRDEYKWFNNNWRLLLDYLDNNLEDVKKNNGVNVAQIVHSYFENFDQESLLNLSNIFKILQINESEDSSNNNGWLQIIKYKETEKAIDNYKVVIGVGKAEPYEKRIIALHEFGHIFHFYLNPEAKSLEENESRGEYVKKENFAWKFALEFSCSKEIRKKWNLEYVNSLVSKEKQSDCINFEHIKALASENKIPIRTVISFLDKHPILDETENCISVFCLRPNQYTGRDFGLRVWHSARPQWVQRIPNQRYFKLGFDYAGDIFDNGQNQETVFKEERLGLKRGRSFKKILDRTIVAYTPVEIENDEKKYLVAIWKWPKDNY